MSVIASLALAVMAVWIMRLTVLVLRDRTLKPRSRYTLAGVGVFGIAVQIVVLIWVVPEI